MRPGWRTLIATLMLLAGLVLIAAHLTGWARMQYSQYRLRREYAGAVPEHSPAPTSPAPAREDPPGIALERWHPMRLLIPKIDLDYIVITGDVHDKKYLDQAPVHYQMSDLPGSESGNVAIAGHRGGSWNFFLRLDELEPGDEIFLETAGYRFAYAVEWIKIVEPTDWSVIESTPDATLTLTTCEPKNRPATHRLVVRARFTGYVLIGAPGTTTDPLEVAK